MICANMIAFGRSAKSSVPYSARLEYIESTGTQWIDTGVIIKYSDIAEAVASINNRNSIFGYVNTLTQQRFNVTGSGLDSYAYFGPTADQLGVTPTSYNTKYTFALGDGKFTIDGTIAGTREYTDDTLDRSLYLFARNHTGNANDYLKGKIYSFSVTRNGVKLLDLIPVLDKAGVACMYDEVSGEFFYNQGEGEFIAGPEIIEYTAKDYIQDGASFFFDGIENAGWGIHSSDAVDWVDLTGQNGITNVNGTWGKDCLQMNGVLGGLLTTAVDLETIEIVVKASVASTAMLVFNANCLASGSGAFRFGFSYRANGTVNFENGGICFTATDVTARTTYAKNFTNGLMYENGISKNGEGGGATFGTRTLGVSQSLKSSYYFKGEICRITGHSRALTAEEIAYNYSIDKARFNLP